MSQRHDGGRRRHDARDRHRARETRDARDPPRETRDAPETRESRKPIVVGNMRIARFDPTTLKDRKTVVIIGKRGSGKSILVKDLMSYKRNLPTGVVMSGTEEGNGFFGTWIPDLFIFNEFDPGVVERVLDQQKRLVKRDKRNQTEGAHDMFLILDDCLYDRGVMRKKCMRELFMNGRHFHVFVVITAQYLMDVPPDIRENVDYVIVLQEDILASRIKLWRNFFGVFHKFEDFNAVMDACTADNRCLVLDTTCKSGKGPESKVFHYKASTRHDDLRMCAPLVWKKHTRHYDPEYDDD